MARKNNKEVKVKICGITNLQDARFVSGALAHFMGFIFYDKSPRYIEPAQAGAIVNWLEGIQCVGVFVNQPIDDVNMIARQTGVDLVQLHGNESPEYCAMIEKPVIKAIHIDSKTTKEYLRAKIESYGESTRYLMFDTKVEGMWGGTGQSFDWSIVRDSVNDEPFFLSGGINSKNVVKAGEVMNPYAVDLSTGVEREPGIKDYDKIEEFMNEMRKINES